MKLPLPCSRESNAINKRGKGFSLVEVLLASSLFALIITAVIGAIAFSQQRTSMSGMKSRALSLAEEGIEASRNIRDEDFSNLTDGNHGLVLSSNTWTFSGSSDTSGIFTRQIQITAINVNTKQITSTVNWSYYGNSYNISLTSYLSNWKAPTKADWAPPSEEASLDLAGLQDGLKIDTQNNYAYLVRNDGTPDFAIIDITNTSNPALAGSLNINAVPSNIAVSGTYAYVTTNKNNQELQIINITNPSSPSVAATFNAGRNANARAQGIYLASSRAYFVRSSSNEDEFFIVNVTNPTSPSQISSLNLGASGNDIVVIGNYAYIASDKDDQELQIVDISNPSSPSLIRTYDLPSTFDALSITGFSNTIFLGRDDGFLYVFDVSNPSNPSVVSSFDAVGAINDLDLKDDNTRLFLATSYANQDFQVLDITNPASLTKIGFLDLSSIAYGVDYNSGKNRAFIANAFDTKEFIVIAP